MPIKPADLKRLRKKLGYTQQEAADTVLSTKRTWQNWEADEDNGNHRFMPEGYIELFCIKNNITYKRVDKKILIEYY